MKALVTILPLFENPSAGVNPRIINHKILDFARKRENAFRIVQGSGRTTVPQFSRKIAAITVIKNMMNAAITYDLSGQCRTIIELQESIHFVLPSTYSRFQKSRNEILDVLAYCREVLANKSFNPTNQ